MMIEGGAVATVSYIRFKRKCWQLTGIILGCDLRGGSGRGGARRARRRARVPSTPCQRRAGACIRTREARARQAAVLAARPSLISLATGRGTALVAGAHPLSTFVIPQ